MTQNIIASNSSSSGGLRPGGGVSTVEDVPEFLIAGAVAVQAATATFVSTAIMPKIVAGLEAWPVRKGSSSGCEVTGTVDGEQKDGSVLMEAAP